MNRDIVVLLSGGIDSTVLAARALQLDRLAAVVFVDYGQPAARQEYLACEGWCHPREIPLYAQTIIGPGLTPLAAGVGVPGPRVVPGRNLLLLAMAVGVASAIPGVTRIWYGANRDDQEAHADCRPGFIHALNQALDQSESVLEVEAPLRHKTRAEVVMFGGELGVDISATWSCYQPTKAGSPCGTCDACRRRA